jgi:hypothetical protein
MKIKKKRVFCEDSSLLYNSIKNEKHNGKYVNNVGIRIGNDMILNEKTNKIESYVSI